ncbi:ATP-binding protein [Streptomyces sp. NPDC057617]|uniref:ATP-binding protein n=1 Tax=Streptomyces sp. NPDC057617 TaxID=3346184 RepID=UPI00368A815F
MTAVGKAGGRKYRQELMVTPENLASIRRIISAHLRHWDYGAIVDIAVYCANELLTNVRQHTESAQCVLTLMRLPAGVRIVVSDMSAELPKVGELDYFAERGRGLASVKALTNAWGAQPTDGGKDVWFEIHCVPSRREAAVSRTSGA